MFRLKLKSMTDINSTLTNWLTDIITTRNNVLFMYIKLDKISNKNNIEFGCAKAICTIWNELVNNYYA